MKNKIDEEISYAINKDEFFEELELQPKDQEILPKQLDILCEAFRTNENINIHFYTDNTRHIFKNITKKQYRYIIALLNHKLYRKRPERTHALYPLLEGFGFKRKDT